MQTNNIILSVLIVIVLVLAVVIAVLVWLFRCRRLLLERQREVIERERREAELLLKKAQKAGGLCLALKGVPVKPTDDVDVDKEYQLIPLDSL
jgi:uncharacterized membrane protein YqiK